MPWPTPLSGRGIQGTASLREIWRISQKQRLDARASNQIVAVAAKRHRHLDYRRISVTAQLVRPRSFLAFPAQQSVLRNANCEFIY